MATGAAAAAIVSAAGVAAAGVAAGGETAERSRQRRPVAVADRQHDLDQVAVAKIGAARDVLAGAFMNSHCSFTRFSFGPASKGSGCGMKSSCTQIGRRICRGFANR